MSARWCALVVLIGGVLQAGKPLWVTIFLHGGGTHPLYFSTSDAFKVMTDHIKGSVYEKTTNFIRHDPYFFQHQPMQHMGLRLAYPLQHMDRRYGAQIFGKFYARINDLVGFKPTLIYSFGWSSLLSIKARRTAARNFYKALSGLVTNLRAKGFDPKLRVLAYSHGGNVALYLAEVARAYKYTPFVIDEFIMISTPVHPNTKLYIKSRIFKRVFLFYSIGDNIQSSDFLSSTDHSFARRFFIEDKRGELPESVTQIQVRFIRKKVVIPSEGEPKKVLHRRDLIQPNHTEMFFFGWSPEWYRRYFPITPLPVILITPVIMRALEKTHICCSRIRVTIIPDENRMEIFVRKTEKTVTVPFLSQKVLSEIKKDLLKFKPTNMNEYVWRMKQHWKNARVFVQARSKIKSRPSVYSHQKAN